jgi:hypothetical protein
MFYVFAIWVMASNVLKGEKGPTVEGPTKKEKEKRSRREKNQEKKEKLAMMKKAKKEKGKGKGKGVWMGMGKGGLKSSKVAPEKKTNTDDNIDQSNGIGADVGSIDGDGGDGGVSDGVSGGDYSLVTPREAEFRRLELHRIFALLQEKKAKQLLATMMEGSLQVPSLLHKLHTRTPRMVLLVGRVDRDCHT